MPESFVWSRIGAALVCALVGVTLVTAIMGVHGFMPFFDPQFAEYDHHAYLAMARDGVGAPGRASAPPYCWRVLTPTLARWLPLPLQAGFFAVSFLAVCATTLLIYFLMRASGFPHDWALAGEIAFLSFFWAVGFNLWDYIMVDAMSLLIITAGLLLLESGRGGPVMTAAVAGVMVLGALNKESYLALAAAAFVWWARQGEGGLARRWSLAALPIVPAIATTLLLRAWIVPDVTQMKEFSSYSLSSVFTTMVVTRLKALPGLAVEAGVDPWGPLVLVPLLSAPLWTVGWFRRHPHRLALLAVAAAQTLVATSVGRLVIAAAPVLLLGAMEALRRGVRQAAPWRPAIAAMLALQFLFQYLRRTTLGLPLYEPSSLVMAAYATRALALIAAGAIWWWVLRSGGARDRRAEATAS